MLDYIILINNSNKKPGINTSDSNYNLCRFLNGLPDKVKKPQ